MQITFDPNNPTDVAAVSKLLSGGGGGGSPTAQPQPPQPPQPPQQPQQPQQPAQPQQQGLPGMPGVPTQPGGGMPAQPAAQPQAAPGGQTHDQLMQRMMAAVSKHAPAHVFQTIQQMVPGFQSVPQATPAMLPQIDAALQSLGV